MKTYVTRCSLLELKQLGSEFAGGDAPTLASLIPHLLMVALYKLVLAILACNTLSVCSLSCTSPCSGAARTVQCK